MWPKFERRYYVTSVHEGGRIHAWESTCGPLPLLGGVNSELIHSWKEYSENEIGSPCVITNWKRLA
jgi:hypothetical protein